MDTFNSTTYNDFFSNAPHMYFTANMCRCHLSKEGLATVSDFADFKKDQLDQAIKNM